MLQGGKKFQKTVKTKFKKNRDKEGSKHFDKNRHHDKSFYRLAKEEKEDYVL
jgi:hypothetical protein